MAMPSQVHVVIVDMQQLPLLFVLVLYLAVDMANVPNHPRTSAHVVMDGQAVTAVKGPVPWMSRGLLYLQLMTKHTLVKRWNVPIWELVIVIRARVHVIPALLAVRANISLALATLTCAMAMENAWI
jgi:hypothetical protein